MPNRIKYNLRQSVSLALPKGFTLTELLVAAFLTLTVVSVGGWAVASMTALSKNSAAQNERRIELNRALDFIASEIRQAAKVNGDDATLPPAFYSPTNTEVSTIQPVLALTIQTLNNPIIYYIASPKPSNKTWLGPQVIYRWGPAFDAAGNYLSTTWTHQPLIDSIENTTSTASCTAGWSVSPKVNQIGFYACIDPQNRVAQLFQVGKLNQALGPSVPYVATDQAFARTSGYTPNQYAGCNNNSCIQNPPPGGGPPGPVTVSYQMVGSDLRCGWKGHPVKVKAIVEVTQPDKTSFQETRIVDPDNLGATAPIVFANQPKGTTIRYTGIVLPAKGTPPEDNPKNDCGLEQPSGQYGFNSDTNPKQVVVLHDGDRPPSYAAFGTGSKQVKDYLKSYIDTDGKITLPDPEKQVIVLFELWSTNTSESAFDMQDLVLLATFEPA
jgi:type II secretory pathway component PulJ